MSFCARTLREFLGAARASWRQSQGAGLLTTTDRADLGRCWWVSQALNPPYGRYAPFERGMDHLEDEGRLAAPRRSHHKRAGATVKPAT